MPRPESEDRPRVWTRIWWMTHGAARRCWTATLLALCVLLYLWIIGLPASWFRPWTQQIDLAPLVLEFDRLTLDPTAGLVANDARILAPGIRAPLAEFESIALRPRWHDGVRIGAIVVRNGRLRVSGPAPSECRAEVPIARIDIDPDRVRVGPAQVHALGLAWDIRGTVTGRVDDAGGEPWPTRVARLLRAAQDGSPGVRDAFDWIASMRFSEPSRADIAFDINLAKPEARSITLNVDTASGRVRGLLVEDLRCAAVIDGFAARISTLDLAVAGHRVHITAESDLRTTVTEARLYTDVDVQVGLSLLPESLRSRVLGAGFTARGPMRAEGWLGPAPWRDLARTWSGWVSVEQSEVRGVWVEKGYVMAKATANGVAVDEISGMIGRAQGRGPFEGSLTWDRDARELSGSLAIGFDPNLVRPWLTSNQIRLVQRFTFNDAPPRFTGSFRLRPDERCALAVTGRITAAAFTYRGVAIDTMSADVTVTGPVVRLDSWTFARPEGAVSGWLRLDLSNHVHTLDLDSRVNPKAIAQMIGPGLQQLMAPVRAEGPVHLVARGAVDGLDGESRTDLALLVDAQRLGVSNLVADTASFHLTARGGRYETTNVSGTIFGGHFTGVATVGPDPFGGQRQYQISAVLTNADLARVAAARAGAPKNIEATGRVRFEIEVSGPTDDPGWRNARGQGRVSVKDGEILRLPVFGGLSKLLSFIVPGLGFAAQNDLTATFRIRQGEFRTDDVRLTGALISMKAQGRYTFTGKLRFTVEVQLLRKGPVAAVLRFVTMPVTKLLKFDLGGTLQEPRWRPSNLPKELFLIFE